MRLYHGSNIAIDHPDISFNKGFADLGQGFYLTDDHDAAVSRACSRARVEGSAHGAVSVFEFDDGVVPWAVWDTELLAPPSHEASAPAPFGLRFERNRAGITAWANYIKSCRKGRSSLESFGEPAVTHAWIATEEVEMVCSGFAPAEALAEFIDPDDLVVQYCFRDQQLIDRALKFLYSESVG